MPQRSLTSQKGFAHFILIIGIVLAAAIGFVVYTAFKTPSPIPEIVKLDFPEKIPLSQRVDGELEFRDGDADLAELRFEQLDTPGISMVDAVADLKSLGAPGLSNGILPFGQIADEPQISLTRLVLVDSAGHRSEPYILKYQAGEPTPFYDHYDKEEAMDRPVSRHKKIHFFILSGTRTDLETDSNFVSDSDAIGNVPPSVAKVFEKTIIPYINGLWDQCGLAFDLGTVKAVRAEKVKLKNGRLLSALYGKHDEVPAVVVSRERIDWFDDALRALEVPKGDFGIFLFGYQLWNLDTNISPAGITSLNTSAVLISLPYIHFLNKDAGEIVLPRRMLSTFAHELGHALGLNHPDEETTIPQSTFGKFNLMHKGSGMSELMPEQCDIVNERN